MEATVTAVAGDSTLARIAVAIQEAQSQRAPTQRFVDQFAHYYTPAVVVLAALVALLGPLLFEMCIRDRSYTKTPIRDRLDKRKIKYISTS